MKYICIALLALISNTNLPMKRCKSWYGLADLTSPLLTNQMQESDATFEAWLSQSFQSEHSKVLGRETKESPLPPKESPRESLNKEPNWDLDVSYYKFNQHQTTSYISHQDKAVFICAAAENISIPSPENMHTPIRGRVAIEYLQAVQSETQKFSSNLFTSFEISTITLHPNGHLLAIAGAESSRNRILIYELEPGKWAKKKQSLNAPQIPLLLAFSPSGMRMLLGYLKPKENHVNHLCVRVLSLVTTKIITELDGFDEYQDLSQLDCGWLNENEIVVIAHGAESGVWQVPSEPT